MIKFLLIFSSYFLSVNAHGYLFEPVARSSAWLVDPAFKDCCTYPNHMEMFCGGIGHQWNVNNGKCGICGEPYDKPVKLFEKGGAMYKGKIVKTYTQGQQIDVKVMLSANHKGYFEFRLCNLDASPSADATEECLDRHLLKIANTDSTRFRDVDKYGSEMITVRVQLPADVACAHCVFQWKYTAANSWGTDPTTGQSGPGLGRENETFMGCSDITILPNGSPTIPPLVIIPTAPTTITSTARPSTASTSSTTNSWWSWSSSSSTATPSTTNSWWPWSSSSSTATPSTTNSWWTWSSSSSTTTGSTDTWTWWPTASSSWTWWSSIASSSTTNSWSQPSTTTIPTSTTTRASLGLTTWSSDFFEYQTGDEVMYDGIKYQCVHPHRSYPGAEPGPLTWAWWKPIEE